MVLVGNKVDSTLRKVKSKNITFHRNKSITYYEVSIKSKFNLETPFLWPARDLLNNQSLVSYRSIPSLRYMDN
jgi:GTP-binding nuclear protein Ran